MADLIRTGSRVYCCRPLISTIRVRWTSTMFLTVVNTFDLLVSFDALIRSVVLLAEHVRCCVHIGGGGAMLFFVDEAG